MFLSFAKSGLRAPSSLSNLALTAFTLSISAGSAITSFSIFMDFVIVSSLPDGVIVPVTFLYPSAEMEYSYVFPLDIE